ncbi:SPOR domain-containing protein [Fictibacillus gelatini]|uniref:SPOR domain-containing protein n=1 Tax=Fictibacillus gelatini TaxID=225985 RepID=UPI000416701E|nr:SPOR domain-containing protein [Fictibacillus gelatini]
MKDHRQITVLINGQDKPLKETGEGSVNTAEELAASVYSDSVPKTFTAEEEGKVLDFQAILERKSSIEFPQVKQKKKKKMTWRPGRLPVKKKSTSRFSKQLLMAVIGAVVIGSGFGAVLLMLFTGELSGAKGEVTASLPASGVVQTSKVAIHDIALDFHVAQGGIYQSKETANRLASSIRAKGYAATVYELDSRYFVYIGVGNNEEQAKSLADMYKNNGIDVYMKPLNVTYKQLKATNKQDEAFFVNGKILLQNMITLAKAPSSSKGSEQSIQKDFSSWKDYLNQQKGSWNTKQKQAALHYEKDLEQTLKQLGSKSNGEVNWKFQQSALNSLVSYTKLLDTLK